MDQRKVRKQIRRTKTGCLCCRLRRKKCDERKPTCVACERNVLICSWPTALLEAQPQIRNHWVPDDLRHVDADRHDRDESSEAAEAEIPRAGSSEIIEAEEVSFNSVAPVTLAWHDFDVELLTPAPVLVEHAQSQHLNHLFIQPSYYHTTFHQVLKNPASQRLFEHYSSRTATLLSAWPGDSNPFISLLLPLAASDDTILHALLALSGVHKSHSHPELENEVTTWSHYAVAVRCLKGGLTQIASGESRKVTSVLVTTIILCFVEVLRFMEATNSKRRNLVVHHLCAAREFLLALLKLPDSETDDVDLQGFLIESYLYLTMTCTMKTGSFSSKSLLEDSSMLFSSDRLLNSKAFGFAFGCAHSLFELIPRVSLLAREREHEEHATGQCSAKSTRLYLALHHEVQKWKAPRPCDPSLRTCGIVYQQALFIFLYAAYYRHAVVDLGLDELAQGPWQIFLSSLESLPMSAPVSTTLCWPLMIFGSGARLESHREPVRRRLSGLYDAWNMPNLNEAGKVLEFMWANQDEYMGPLDIERAMETTNIDLAMA